MGPQELKNVSAPLERYRVQGEGEAHTRFEVSVQKGLRPRLARRRGFVATFHLRGISLCFSTDREVEERRHDRLQREPL